MKTIAVKTISALLVSALLSAPSAFAQDRHHDHANQSSTGEVRKIDKEAKKITIKHGPLQALDMPAMTMVYRVKDPAMLDQVKMGDKVKFQAEKVDGGLIVTRIAPAK